MSILKRTILFLGVFSLILVAFPKYSLGLEQAKGVEQWANRLGKELWDLGELITKSSEIKSNYKFLHAQIEKKEPKKLLAEIVDNIARMMDRKTDAIRCILEKAEDEAEAFQFDASNINNYTYYNSKRPRTTGDEEEFFYNEMQLTRDTHFYNIPVNASHSSVHLPTNIYDRHPEAAIAIQWSEALDEVFKQNYKSDPSLSWQYFGSSSGMMRHYPAMEWTEKENDLFDCRIRTWFIEAATCTKDIVILLDNSGSMTGMKKHIAAFTVNSILDTFSNNDYINILNFSTTVDCIVPCFKGQLIQATRENIMMFKYAVKLLEANQKSSLVEALIEAFKILKQYREIRGCSESSRDCNQAIMIVTDGVPRNMSSILREYNLLRYSNSIPVRIFAYLIGKEATNLDELTWMACANRGYFTHIRTLEEVTGAVLKYIPVVARPLVLQQEDHPHSWTHAYTDITYDDEMDELINEPYRLLTTVAIPAYDRKLNSESKTAELLGVAATDVPIDDIRKLTFPYKIGVNGYAFVVSNNGYIIWHPALRPMLGKLLNKNFNSVDFTEVEQLDTELPPRVLSEIILKLRNGLINGKQDSIENVKLKYHYDNMRRVTRAIYNYYFDHLEGTPFTVGIAIPQDYGNFAVEVGDVIQKNKHTSIQITDFFEGTNWRVHPKWVYCRYHYLEGHVFKTPEEELIHFLKQMYNPDFKWKRQYEAATLKKHEIYDLLVAELGKVECGRKVLGDDDYYCDEQLVQRLIFDAEGTQYAFKEPWTFKNEREELLFKKYNATLRFVATMSGLTRWEYIFGEEENNTSKFGDFHARAIDEQWYKSAVFQHQYDRESFVYSVPFDAQEKEDIFVTGTYAIFPEDAGIEAPGSVVGFQFSHSQLEKQFFTISANCPKCIPCGHNHMLDCYLIDSSGYIIVSHDKTDTGKFFGEVEGAVMETLIEKKIYEKVTVYDYQAFCFDEPSDSSSSSAINTAFDYIRNFVELILSRLLWVIVEINFYQLWDPNWIYSEPLEIVVEEGKEEVHHRSCDKERDLYFLNQTQFFGGNTHFGKVKTKCARPFYVQKVPHSNMLLVAVETMHQQCYKKFSAEPREIIYENYTYPCQKLNLNNLPRRRLAGCYNEHPREQEITTCGKSNLITFEKVLLFLVIVTIY